MIRLLPEPIKTRREPMLSCPHPADDQTRILWQRHRWVLCTWCGGAEIDGPANHPSRMFDQDTTDE